MRHGLTEDEFSAWLQHPATQKFRRYLFDLRATFRESWALGHYGTPEAETEYRHRCRQLQELIDISFETIDEFYHDPADTPAASEERQ